MKFQSLFPGLACLALLTMIQPLQAQSEAAPQNLAQVTASAARHITLGGFVRTDFIFDSRQSQAGAEGLFTYYPLPEQPDDQGNDINDASSANILALTSRLTAAYTGPEISGAQTRAYVEADFGSNLYGNGAVFRMRQAYMELKWEHSSLLLGQTWHPMSAAVVPVTLDLNTGAPFRPFSRSPQIRFTHALGAFQVSAAAVYQHSYASSGPDGVSSKYLRNAVWPEWTLGVEWHASDQWSWGIMGETKALRPRLSLTQTATWSTSIPSSTVRTEETVRSWSGQTWVQHVSGDFQLKAAAIYAQNMSDAQMIGGYAEADALEAYMVIADDFTNHMTYCDVTLTKGPSYTPTQHLSGWLMLQYGRKVQAGLFAGCLKSLGTLDKVHGDAVFPDDREPIAPMAFYGRACNMDWMFRVAPRVSCNMGNLQLAGEVEWNRACFGELVPDTKGDIAGGQAVDDIKVDIAMSFFF